MKGDMIAFPSKKYSVIYADPAWKYNARKNTNTKFGGGAMGHYNTMSTKEICELPVQRIADDNCMIFLWVTPPKMKDGIQVLEAWGFQYLTIGFNWIKFNNDGSPFFGVGYYTKSNGEQCLLGRKGKPIKISDCVSSVILSPKLGHSQKPPEVRRRIVQLCGDIPRIELFAREKVDGWDAWGDQL